MQSSVTEWLNSVATLYPDKVALSDSSTALTFVEYKEKSYAIATAIIQTGVGKQKPVVVYLEKGIEVLVSFLGIAYSRNFYSPIDTDMPKSRINKILEILHPEIIITTKSLKEAFSQFDFSGIFLYYEDVMTELADSKLVSKVSSEIIDTDLLYVLFTSGSTGIPKGVGICHRSVIDYIDWVTEEFHITEKDSFGNQAPFYFDNSILDIYTSLKTGAALYIIPKELFSQPVPLLEYLKDYAVSTIFWVPSALITVAKLRALKNVDLSKTLKRVLFCGEVMPNKQLNFWRKFLPDVIYANLYGPTEITDACTYYVVNREFADEEPLPIGRPMKNTEIIVLNEQNELVGEEEKGVIGELCVRGTSLAVGYYNNPEKTEDAFVQNPLNKSYEEKIYRTGDLVCYNEYREIVYVGRKDFQIKHLGHRIELGEIETAVSSLDEDWRCCCLYDEKRNKIIMVLETAKDTALRDINERLRELVPEYMLPGRIITVSEMPLNANGKIDRKRLREELG